jgi:hypothetical protein
MNNSSYIGSGCLTLTDFISHRENTRLLIAEIAEITGVGVDVDVVPNYCCFRCADYWYSTFPTGVDRNLIIYALNRCMYEMDDEYDFDDDSENGDIF